MTDFVAVDDDVVVRILIDDLATLAPIPDKAFQAQVGGEEWRLWYNRSLDAINIQPRSSFDEQKPTKKIGVKRTPTALSFYFENKAASGVPSDLIAAIPTLSEQVRKAKKLFDKGSLFDPESLKLIFQYMKEGSMTADNPLKVKLTDKPVEKYCLWTKRVHTSPSPLEIRGGAEPEVKYYLNIQDEKKFDERVQENKLGLEIDEEGRVTSINADGVAKPPEENDALLFDSEGIWNKRLTRIIKQFLADKGFDNPKKDGLLKIHLLTLQKIPEIVLTKWSKLATKPNRVNFMDNKFKPGPGCDAGGLTKQFHSDLAKALFDGRSGRGFRVDESGCPYAQGGVVQDSALAKSVGEFLSEVSRRDLTIGRILPECFFKLLKVIVENPKASEKRSVTIAELFAGEYQRPIVAWLKGDEGKREEAVEMMGYAGEEGLDDMDEKQQRERAVQYLNGLVDPYLSLASAIAAGFSKALTDLFKAKSAAEMSEALQGKQLDADDIASRIKTYVKNAVISQKIDFLKAHIRERLEAGDTDWVERFLVCVTGQRAVKGGTAININASHDSLCRTHTCSNGLDLPTTHETPPLDVKDKKLRFIRNLEMTMAETGYSNS